MRVLTSLAAAVVLAGGLTGWQPFANADAEDDMAAHMVGEALLAAHFVAAAERAGMSEDAIRAALKDVVAHSAIDEIWITDETGRAYLNSEGVEFAFDPDPARQPQGSAFWPLLEGEKTVVIQEARQREIDDQVFRYVGVAGVDRPRIVQVGIKVERPSE